VKGNNDLKIQDQTVQAILKAKQREIEHLNVELSSAKQEWANARGQLHFFQKSNHLFHSENLDLKAKNSSLKNQVEIFRHANDLFDLQNSDLKAENSSLKDQVQIFRQRSFELQQANALG